MKKRKSASPSPAPAPAQLGCEYVYGHCPLLEGVLIALEMTPSQIKGAAAYSGGARKAWPEGRRYALLDLLHFIDDLRAMAGQ
jgi:hypothetical protein